MTREMRVALCATICAVAAVVCITDCARAGCTSGVASGEVTADGRPLLWKVRMEAALPNVVQYSPAGVDNDGDGTVDAYGYLGIAPYNARLRMGLNSAGVATACNTLYGGTQSVVHEKVLGNYTSVSQVQSLYDSGALDSYWRDFFFAMDSGGNGRLWEASPYTVTVDPPYPYYDVTAPARGSQYYNGVTLSGYVVRDNTAHNHLDGSDNTSLGGRYAAGMGVVTGLIAQNKLTAGNILQQFTRNPTLAPSNDIAAMVVQGVLPSEDTRLSTMWSMLGYTRTSIGVPLWVHGVATANGDVPDELEYNAANPNQCIATLANRMHANGYDFDNVEARTKPFQQKLTDAVADVLLPSWRSRQDWSTIGTEMDRVSKQMSKDARSLLAYLDAHGATSGNAPSVSINLGGINGLAADFSWLVFDDDDLNSIDDAEAVSLSFNFGGAGHACRRHVHVRGRRTVPRLPDRHRRRGHQPDGVDVRHRPRAGNADHADCGHGGGDPTPARELTVKPSAAPVAVGSTGACRLHPSIFARSSRLRRTFSRPRVGRAEACRPGPS